MSMSLDFVSVDSATDGLFWVLHRLRYMFYMVLPSETMYPDVSVVPRLVVEVSL